LRKVEIQGTIEVRQTELRKSTTVTKYKIIKEYSKLAFLNVGKLAEVRYLSQISEYDLS